MYDKNLWKKETIIKDVVHGYISIPKPIMREIVDTKTFQRLKNIEQTGMESLYPSATHNRFTHSLGVYHLAKKAFGQFEKNVKWDFPNLYKRMANRYEKNAAKIWERWGLLFQLSALLHDCGHAPYSHTLEFIYDLEGVEQCLMQRLNDGMSNVFQADIKEGEGGYCGKPHERMSAYYIKTKGAGFFRDHVKILLINYAANFLEPEQGTVYDKFDGLMNDDIEFMMRMITGCHYHIKNADSYYGEQCHDNKEDWMVELQIRNCIIKMLNSKLDVDNLDYVVRDSKFSGYANHSVDIERLLSSFTIVTAYEFDSLDLTEGQRLDYCVNLQQFVGKSINARISGECIIKNNTRDIKATGNVDLEDGKKESGFLCRSLKTLESFSALVEYSGQENETVEINPKHKEDYCYLNIRGSMEGKMKGTILTNDMPIPEQWKKSGQERIYFAYYQNSMSVLMSAIEGSNFEGKWIYAHKTSTFINDFLNIYLLEKYAQILKELDLTSYKKEYCQLQRNKDEIFQGAVDVEKTDKALQDNLEKLLEECFKENEPVKEYLTADMPASVVESIEALYEAVYTRKKIDESLENQYFKQLALTCAKDQKILQAEYLKDLKEFNNRTMRLRGGEIQYLWDIIAMCGTDVEFQGHRFSKSDDEDLVSVYKQVYLDFILNSDEERFQDKLIHNMYQEFCDIFEYLEKRRYMKCLWKSYPEYLFYFQDWTDKERKSLVDFLKPTSVPPGVEYLVLSDTVGPMRASKKQGIFWSYLKSEYGLKRFVCVKQKIRTKQFLPHETYMKRNSRVVRLEDIGLYDSAQKKESFLYFYYEISNHQKQGKTENNLIKNGEITDGGIVDIIEWLRNAIKDENFLKEQTERYNVV